jgi:hypothetical protein
VIAAALLLLLLGRVQEQYLPERTEAAAGCCCLQLQLQQTLSCLAAAKCSQRHLRLQCPLFAKPMLSSPLLLLLLWG